MGWFSRRPSSPSYADLVQEQREAMLTNLRLPRIALKAKPFKSTYEECSYIAQTTTIRWLKPNGK